MSRKDIPIFGCLLMLLYFCGAIGYAAETAVIGVSASVETAIGFEPAFDSDIINESRGNLRIRMPATGHAICRIESGDKVSESILGDSGIKDKYLLDGQVLPFDYFIFDMADRLKTDSCTITIIYTEN